MSDPSRPPGVQVARPAVTTLVLDDRQLAQRARTTLAAADVATVIGATSLPVRICDHDGEPVVFDLPTALAGGRERGRRVSMVIAPRLADGVWLVLDGTVQRRGRHMVLAVDAVHVGCPHRPGATRTLDLAAYATAEPDLLQAGMPRVMAHANAVHGPELRELAARRLRVPVDTVVGAQLADLTADAVTLVVTDLRGGHHQRLALARPARSFDELGRLLRAVLTA